MSIDFDIRKCIHLRFRTDVHAAFKMECERRNLSMQAVLEEFANKFAEGDAQLNDIVNQIPLKRYNAKLQYNPKFVLRNDVESLYDYFDSIEDSSQESNDK